MSYKSVLAGAALVGVCCGSLWTVAPANAQEVCTTAPAIPTGASDGVWLPGVDCGTFLFEPAELAGSGITDVPFTITVLFRPGFGDPLALLDPGTNNISDTIIVSADQGILSLTSDLEIGSFAGTFQSVTETGGWQDITAFYRGQQVSVFSDLNTNGAPGPIAGAGLPGLLMAGGGLFAWWRGRKKSTEILMHS